MSHGWNVFVRLMSSSGMLLLQGTTLNGYEISLISGCLKSLL